MIVKASFSRMFPSSDPLLIAGLPVRAGDKQIGIVAYIDPKKDLVYLDIDELYKGQFEQQTTCSMEII